MEGPLSHPKYLNTRYHTRKENQQAVKRCVGIFVESPQNTHKTCIRVEVLDI